MTDQIMPTYRNNYSFNGARRGPSRANRAPRIGATVPVPTKPVDGWLLFCIISLVIIGTLAVFDASYVKAADTREAGYNPYFYLIQQMKWLCVGAVAFLVGANFGYWKFRRLAPMGLLLSLGALTLILISDLGASSHGARRWLDLGPIRLQPSEFAKIALVFYMAHFLVRNRRRIRDLKEGFLPALLPIALVAFLIMKGRDMGTMLATCGVAVGLLFLGGARLRHVFSLILVAALGVAGMVMMEPYRLRRIFTYLDPNQDPDGAGYQILHGLAALGSGGPFGVGIGESRAKWLYLPAEHTDFIFAIIGEELGLIGTILIVGLFGLLLYRGFVIAGRCRNPFGQLLAMGITMTVCLQASINIAVVTSVIPNTGVPLPLISYGGTSLVVTLFALGVLADVSRRPSLPWEINEENDSRTNRRWDRGTYLSGAGDRRNARSTRRSRSLYR